MTSRFTPAALCLTLLTLFLGACSKDNNEPDPDIPQHDWVAVAGGSFTLGCTSSNSYPVVDAMPAHPVTVSNFYITRTEITNEQFARFLNSYGSDQVKSGPFEGEKLIYETDINYAWGVRIEEGVWVPAPGMQNYPVVYVTWYGANEYCSWAGGRLPTEAEWEYAARGGARKDNFEYSGDGSPRVVAWFALNSERRTRAIGGREPNGLGILDMSGNVAEFCSDWYSTNTYVTQYEQSLSGAVRNPTGPETGTLKVVRGGHCKSGENMITVYNRQSLEPAGNNNYTGFRMVKR